jgi:hypothetical protein
MPTRDCARCGAKPFERLERPLATPTTSIAAAGRLVGMTALAAAGAVLAVLLIAAAIGKLVG